MSGSGISAAVETLLAWKAAVVVVWLAAFFIGERLRPAAPEAGKADLGGWHRVARNAGLWVANVGLSPLIVIPVSAWAATHALDWRPDWWSGWQGLLIDLVLLDFWIYWWHKANHEMPFLWRFHEVHHLDGFLDTTTAVRFHFGEVLLSAGARALAIILLGIPLASVLVFEVLVLMAAIFHHSNLRLPAGLERTLSAVVITPAIHWVHHHKVRRDTDSNYGTIFSFWDRIFGSRSRTRRWSDMPIGVEGRREKPFPQLLVAPFRPRQARARPVSTGQ